MNDFITFLIDVLVFGNYLDVNTGNLGQLDRTEDKATLGAGYEGFSGLGEHHFGTMDVTLVAVFILQDTVLQALQGDGLAHITLAVIVVDCDDFDAGGRNVERNLSTLDDQNLAVDIGILGILDYITFSISHFTDALGSLFCFVNTSQKILVGAQSVTLDDLSHLAGIQSEGNRTAQVDLAADVDILRQIICAGDGVAIILNGVLQDNVPVLRGSCEQIYDFIVAALHKALASGVKANQLIGIGEAGLGRSYPTYDMTLSFVKDVGIFVNRQDKIFLHFRHWMISFPLFFFILYVYIISFFFIKIKGNKKNGNFRRSSHYN